MPGGPVVCWLVACLGAVAVAFAGIVCLIPPPDSAHPALFVLKGVGGCVLILVLGFVMYARGNKRHARSVATPDSGRSQ